MTKKILIIGAGVEQAPAIQMAKDLGYHVLTSDYNPDAPGMRIADQSFVISTDDKEGNLEVAIQNQINGVMTLCSETAVPVVGYICEKMGLKGFSEDTALKSTNKGSMRIAMEENRVPMPARAHIDLFSEAEEFTSEHSGPWVLKPSDSSGQRGTNLVSERSKLLESFEEAKEYSTDDKVLIDQFVGGQEINVCAVVKNGEVHVLSLADRNTLPSPYFGIAINHIAPPALSTEEIDQVLEVVEGSIKAIGLENGIAYPQIIVSKDGPKLIEIAARIPGGYNREMAMNLSGVDMIKAQILLALDEDFSVQELVESPKHKSSGVKLLTSVDYPELVGATLKQIEGKEKVLAIPGVQACHFHIQTGDVIPHLENSVGRFMAIIAVGESKEEVQNILLKAKEVIKIIC
ncbi:MAG: biotin carboxylase [Salibacteraceae bacterium]|jgi:biotin carboxylase